MTQPDLFTKDKSKTVFVKLTRFDKEYSEVLDENSNYILVRTPKGHKICWKKPIHEIKEEQL